MKFCYDCANIIEENIQRCPYCGGNLNDAEPKEAYHLKPGTTLKNGRYLLGRAIGYGGFGVTYAGFDLTLQRRVAIKEYFPFGYANRSVSESKLNVYTGDRMAQYSTGLSHFLLEARNMAKFGKEPNIVSVLDFFEANNTAYIVMEYLDGMDLKHYLKQVGGILPYQQAIEIIKPICLALTKIHKERVVHRDISPDNIFITADNSIKLIDFGAARLALGNREETLPVILKPGFAPPEQYRAKSAQGSYTDIYALAATFYRMITGKMPPASTDRLIGDVLVPPSAIVKGIPKNVDNAVMQAMALDAGARFAAAIDFLKALERENSKAVPAPLPLDVPEKNKEPSATTEKANKIRNIIIAAVSGVVACALLFTILYLSGALGGNDSGALDGNDKPIVFATPMPTPTFTPMPTPTPSPTPKPTPTPEITAAPTPSSEPSPMPVVFRNANFEAAFRSKYHVFGTIAPETLLNYTELDLSECALTDISDVAMFENLQVLTLRKNEISDVEPISALTGLTSLDLFTNKISDISPLFMLTGLTTLNLGVNEITDIWILSRFTDLVWLNLNYNQITDISSLAGLTKLEHLNLHDNKVTYIGALSQLTSLTWLNLNRCSLTAYTDISPLYNLIWLEELYIKKGNSLTQAQIDTIQTYLTGTMIH